MDDLLVGWALTSAPGEGEVCARTALTVEPRLVRELATLATRMDRLLRRMSRQALAQPPGMTGWRPPEFPLAKEFFAAGSLTQPFFWSRWDVFERADGGLAVLEYNCDKPAGQREIWAGAGLHPDAANPNAGARDAFRHALARAWRAHDKRSRTPRVAILVDPSHREEFRLAYLYGRELTRLGWPWSVAGPENLTCDGERAMAFGAPVDVVLRQYPSEFLHELPAMAELWHVTQRGGLLWLNDPRAAAVQAKSLLALAWRCALEAQMPKGDVQLVREHIPPTGVATDAVWLERARARQEDWVIKPVLGRYSQGVALGAACTAADWHRALEMAAAQPHDYVIQAYVPPRRRWLPGPAGARAGYVNWGVALAAGQFAGLLPRCQPTPLTEEWSTWWAPLRTGVITPRAPVVLRPRRAEAGPRGVGRAWLGIADRCALAGYTNVWTNGMANFTLAAIGLTPADWDELAHATILLGRATARAVAQLHDPALIELLDIPRSVARLIAQTAAGVPNFLSRYDWARTRDGRWQLLEINSDTPAGLWETGLASSEVAARHHGRAVIGDFWSALTQAWRLAVGHALGRDARAAPLTLGLVGALACQEDADQVRAHAHAARMALPLARLIVGDIGEIRVDERAAHLRSTRLDVLFRYYPLDWCVDAEQQRWLELVAAGRLAMVPPATAVLSQSKAFLALLHELNEQGFFPPEDAAAIRSYVPPTSLASPRLGRGAWVAKPFLEREGHGVRFSRDLARSDRRRLARADVVFQREVDLVAARVPIGTARGWREEKRFLVFGVFLAGEAVGGIYTRAGARVTGREAVCVPTVLRRSSAEARAVRQ